MRHEWDIIPGEAPAAMRNRVALDMSAALGDADALDVLRYGRELFAERMAVVSSFGAESVVLLHLAAQVDPKLAVLFIDTQMLFAETLSYQLDVAKSLGLTNVRRISADERVLRLADRDGTLHQTAPDDCCHLRKTLVLETELLKYGAWVTGRKRHQTQDRAAMNVVEVDHADRIKINPLANWTVSDIADYMDAHDLPRHPLVAEGFQSIGCAPCTTKTLPGEDPRAGRWRDAEKTECGIHFGADGKIVRSSGKAA